MKEGRVFTVPQVVHVRYQKLTHQSLGMPITIVL